MLRQCGVCASVRSVAIAVVWFWLSDRGHKERKEKAGAGARIDQSQVGECQNPVHLASDLSVMNDETLRFELLSL